MRTRLQRWMSRYADASPLAMASGLTLVCLPAVLAIAWVSTDYWANRRIEAAIQRQTLQIARQLTDAEVDIEATFGGIKSITTWVAEEGHALSAIVKPASADEASFFLEGIASGFGLDLIYIMNASGISVAASNWDTPATTVGRDYSDREHFQTAMTGVPGRQFAVGRTTRVPGFFFSMPVRRGGDVVGTVGVKYDQPRLQHLVRIAGSLITDDYGVVVMAENPKYMFHALPDNTTSSLSPEQRMNRYARTEFEVLPLVPAGIAKHPDIMSFDGRPVLMGRRTLIDAGLTVNVLSDFDMLPDMQRLRQQVLIFGVSATLLLLWGLWVAIFYFLRARDYRRRLEAANRQLSSLNNELHEQANHDFLTGTHNRRAFNALLSNELERVKRYGGELSLGLIDIDHFKLINDTHGHAVGDRALKFLVDTISQRMRRSDVLARLGGEEFVLLMPNTSVVEAGGVIDRIREAIAVSPLPGHTPELRFSFSAGVAGWRPGLSERALLNAADEALYAAKREGRNRVVLAAH